MGLQGQTRGGKREGAGRPKNNVEPTTRIRLPESQAKFIKEGKLEELLAKIEDWKYRAEDAEGNSPRWYFCKEMIEELESIINEEQ